MCRFSFLCFFEWVVWGIDWVIKWLGNWGGRVYAYPWVIGAQSMVGYTVCVLCGVKTQHWSVFMFIVFAGGGLLIVVVFAFLIEIGYQATRNIHRTWVNEYRALHILVKTLGSLWITRSFVYLINDIEKAKHVDVYAVGFFLGSHLLVVSASKLFESEDFYGVGDCLLAVAVMIWVNFPDAMLGGYAKSAWWGFYGACLLLTLFKISGVKVRGAQIVSQNNDDGPENENPASPLLPLASSSDSPLPVAPDHQRLQSAHPDIRGY